MSTTKPRITITLQPHHHEVLSRLSRTSGESMSQIVAQFVAMAVPSLERLVVVLERASAAKEEVNAGLVAAVDRAERKLMPTLVEALDQAELFLTEAERATAPRPDPDAPAAGPGLGSRGKRAGGGPTPVPVTRGSGGPDDVAGMVWWNGLTEAQRASWARQSGGTGVVADVWAYAKRMGVRA